MKMFNLNGTRIDLDKIISYEVWEPRRLCNSGGIQSADINWYGSQIGVDNIGENSIVLHITFQGKYGVRLINTSREWIEKLDAAMGEL